MACLCVRGGAEQTPRGPAAAADYAHFLCVCLISSNSISSTGGSQEAAASAGVPPLNVLIRSPQPSVLVSKHQHTHGEGLKRPRGGCATDYGDAVRNYVNFVGHIIRAADSYRVKTIGNNKDDTVGRGQSR